MRHDRDFDDYIKAAADKSTTDPLIRPIMYRYLGDGNKSVEAFIQALGEYDMPESRLDGLSQSELDSDFFIIRHGIALIRSADKNKLAGLDSNATQLYLWGLETLSEREKKRDDLLSHKMFESLAQIYLWRSYAFLMLGRFADAHESLKPVYQLLHRHILTGSELSHSMEVELPKALIPICEYKLKPSEENRQRAAGGIEKFIDSFEGTYISDDFFYKLAALDQYYAIKESFPEIYDADQVIPGNEKPQDNEAIPFEPISTVDACRRGAVVIADPEDHAEIIGTEEDLETYVKKVKECGDYPLLSTLNDHLDKKASPGMSPDRLIAETEMLLSQTKDDWLREKTELLLDVARQSQGTYKRVYVIFEPIISRALRGTKKLEQHKSFRKYLTGRMQDQNAMIREKGLAYRFLGDENKSDDLLRSAVADFKITGAGFEYFEGDERRQTDYSNMHNLVVSHIDRAALFDLTRPNVNHASQHYAWTIEGSDKVEDIIKNRLRVDEHQYLANAFLWRGYAFLMLRRYQEAGESLHQVSPAFKKERASGREVWQYIEVALEKVLVPLCDYLSDPSKSGRDKARKSMSGFINNIELEHLKLEALLYYYHLKERFPEVYGDVENETLYKAAKKRKTSRKTSLVPAQGKVDDRGAVVVSDNDRGSLDIFGRPDELIKFIEIVGKMEGFPVLSGLLEYYNNEGTQGMNPEELYAECERLLKAVSDQWLIGKIAPLHNIAKNTMCTGSTVLLYQDTEISMDV